MKHFITLCVLVIGLSGVLQAKDVYYCNTMCKMEIDEFSGITTDLTCHLPSMPNFTLTAENVLNTEGKKRLYWGKKTVCDVLGWMEKAVSPMKTSHTGIDISNLSGSASLKFKSLTGSPGGMASSEGIMLDTDMESSNRHWKQMHFITVHEFSHLIIKHNSGGVFIEPWIEEARARDFEDIVYDSQNSYADTVAYAPMYGKNIAGVLADGLENFDNRYANFAFLKEIQNKCGVYRMKALLPKLPNLRSAVSGCDFIDASGDKLSGAFALYNWAMLYKKDFSLIDGNEESTPTSKLFKGSYRTIDEAGFSEKVNLVSSSTLAPFSAKSFLITKETLQGCGDITMELESDGDVKVVAISDKGGNGISNYFSLISGKTHILSMEEKIYNLFVTVTNTTNSTKQIKSLLLSKASALKPLNTIDGEIEVTLSWTCASDVDLNLYLTGNSVINDVKDVENLGLEHAYVASQSSIHPGDALVASSTGTKRPKSSLKESYLEDHPINIYAVVKTPGGSKFKQWEAQNFGQLTLGEFAAIEVKNKKFETSYYSFPSSTYEHQPTVIPNTKPYVRTYNECDEKDKKYTCQCVPCEYIIHGMDGAVEYGPIGGAEVEIIRADTYGSAHPVVAYRGKTTNDSDLFKSGLVKFTQSDYAKFEEDVYYVVDAKGGKDLDRDDDLVKDTTPTPNNGTIHAIIKGSDLKTVAFRVNALTEAIYQTTGDLLGSGYDSVKLDEKLAQASRKLFREKTFIFNNEININYHDALLWAPGVDKKKLFKAYDTFVEPIVVKTYADEARVKESYRLIYEKLDTDAPQLTPLAVEVPHTIPNNSIIGKVSIESVGISGIDHIELHGEHNSSFSIDKEGLVKIVDNSILSIDAIYKLDMVAVGADSKRSISMELVVKVIEGVPLADPNATVPTLESMVVDDIVENSVSGTVVGQANFVDSSLNIVGYTLSGEDNDSFAIDSTGEITVADGADIDYEKSDTYTVKVSAMNEAGNESFPVRISFNIINEIDTPLHDLVYLTHLSENVPIGTVVGEIVKLREGRSPITSFDILNPNVPFALDVNGTIRTTGYIDYETAEEYNLLAMAKTNSGNGNKVEIQILINDVSPEIGKPSLQALNISIDENSNESIEVGRLNIVQGASSVELVELRGTGHSNFSVDINGTIRVASGATLDYEQKTRYTLQAIAHNTHGSSALVSVNIFINNIDDEVPIITLLGQNPINLIVGDTYTDAGATANDVRDGNVTSRIRVNNTVDTTKVGTYTVTYDVHDTAGNNAQQVTRTVIVALPADVGAPVITLLGDNPINLIVGTEYVDAGATASDERDGDVTVNIITVYTVDSKTAGTYTVTYDVNDTAGNNAERVTRTVVVEEPVNLVPRVSIEIMRDLVNNTLHVGESVELGAVASDKDGTIVAYEWKDGSEVISDSDSIIYLPTRLGEHNISVTVTDDDGATDTASIVLNVLDDDAPIITLNGASVITLNIGDVYEELGASASDVGDGNITELIVIDASTVDSSVEGNYTVTYNVKDSSDNAAQTVNRTVRVITASLTREGLIELIKNWAKDSSEENAKLITHANTSEITDMSCLFAINYDPFDPSIKMIDCNEYPYGEFVDTELRNFNLDISGWDVSNVTNMKGMFFMYVENRGGTEFNQDISKWDVSNVTNMKGMFYDANKFNQDISNWNVSSVTNSENFATNTPLPLAYNPFFDIHGKFTREELILVIKNWANDPIEANANAIINADTSRITDMSYLFYEYNEEYTNLSTVAKNRLINFNLDISKWDTSSVTNMEVMFSGLISFNQPIGAWDTSSVTNMYAMLYLAKAFNQPLDAWDTSSVTDMSYLFLECDVFNQPLNTWDTSSVTDMKFMFDYAKAFNQNISNWNVLNVVNHDGFLSGSALETQNLPNFP